MDEFIRYFWIVKPDPPGLEYVEAPDLQLCKMESGDGYLYGDCDDASTLAAALLAANQIRCWFVAIRLEGESDFSHVFLRTPERDIDPIVPVSILPHQRYAEKIEVMV